MDLDSSDLWRRIPLEEKIELMARAQAKGVSAAAACIVICSTVAVGLQFSMLLWGSMLAAPLIFQYAAGKAWRGFRPRLMLEYLAARSAARRYAFAANGHDLTVLFLMKGEMHRKTDGTDIDIQFSADGSTESMVLPVWIALFGDSVVIMAEGVRGASCQFAHLLDDKFSLEGRSDSGKEYTNDRELHIHFFDRKFTGAQKIVLTSRYPAALIVFEKLLLAQLSSSQLSRTKAAVVDVELIASVAPGKASSGAFDFDSELIGM